MTAKAGILSALLAALVLLLPRFCGAGEETGEWRALLTVRFGNVDAIDADDGDLARFLRAIRNDGRFSPPLRTLIGPVLRNPTFFGISAEAWLECSLLAPAKPGGVQCVWVFPVDSRNEYLMQLANQGVVEYEGMDGVSVLREFTADGGVREWHLEWLPGNLAVFGIDRGAVAATRRRYAENSASRGLLAGTAGALVAPDVQIRLDPSRLVGWQDQEPGRYWWRDRLEMLARDLIAYWRTAPARTRLINSLAEEAIAWPRTLERVDCSLWFEERGIEWRLETTGGGARWPSPSQLSSLRRLPERAVLAFAAPLDKQAFAELGSLAGRLLLGAAGGAVSTEAREGAADLFGLLARARPLQSASAWVIPPAAQPELGASRLLLVEWGVPEALDVFWPAFVRAVGPGGVADSFFSQVGWKFSLVQDRLGNVRVTIRPVGGDASVPPLYDALFASARNGAWLAVAGGKGRVDEAERERVLAHRAALAAEAAAANGPGVPDIRGAFTGMGPDGAVALGMLDPVRFCQLVLIEAADWRPHRPDQQESLSTRLAREMLEYGSGGSWSAVGEAGRGGMRLNGNLPWPSLIRLCGALGITESIGME